MKREIYISWQFHATVPTTFGGHCSIKWRASSFGPLQSTGPYHIGDGVNNSGEKSKDATRLDGKLKVASRSFIRKSNERT